MIVLVNSYDLIKALHYHNNVGAGCIDWTIPCQGDTLLALHKMLAAIACKQYAIVEKLLPECAADIGFPNAPRLLCNTLALALHFRTFYRTYSVEDPRSVPKDQKLLETILKYLKSLNLQDKGNEALCKVLVTDSLAVFEFATAIEDVIGAKANKVLKQLLDFHANHLARPDRSNFTMWFRLVEGSEVLGKG